MTKVVKVDFKESKSLAPLGVLDALSRDAQLVVDLRAGIGKFLEAEPDSLEDADKHISVLMRSKPSEQHLTELSVQIEHGFRRATPEQIQKQLAALLGAFPSSYAPDPTVYSRMMLNEVMTAEPSIIVLAMACAELRRTRQWPPPIADVLKAIQEQELRWQHYRRDASTILDTHAEALSKLCRHRARLARSDEEKKAEQHDRLRRLECLKRQITSSAA